MAEAPAEYSRKFLPREILSLNATYKHMNIVRRSLPHLLSIPCPTSPLGTSFLSLHEESSLTLHLRASMSDIPRTLGPASLRMTVYMEYRGVFARFSCMRPTRTASAPTWYWSWQVEVTCWSTSIQCHTSDVAQDWRRKRPEGCSGNWSVLWPTATMLALCTGEGAIWPICLPGCLLTHWSPAPHSLLPQGLEM